MKTLLLMRHGKSSWEDTTLDDYERPLKKRGIKAAKAIGLELKRRGLTPDLILSSGAKRAVETARLTAEAVGFQGETVTTDSLYFSGTREQIGMFSELDDKYRVVMAFGHNPGMETLVSELAGETVTMPTAALAQLEFDVESWGELAGVNGKLADLVLPRELD